MTPTRRFAFFKAVGLILAIAVATVGLKTIRAQDASNRICYACVVDIPDSWCTTAAPGAGGYPTCNTVFVGGHWQCQPSGVPCNPFFRTDVDGDGTVSGASKGSLSIGRWGTDVERQDRLMLGSFFAMADGAKARNCKGLVVARSYGRDQGLKTRRGLQRISV